MKKWCQASADAPSWARSSRDSWKLWFEVGQVSIDRVALSRTAQEALSRAHERHLEVNGMKAYQPTNQKSWAQGFVGHAILLPAMPSIQWRNRATVISM